jgi:2-polyprenyl-3-methyl-5-hydroxy-6-metoxy-1,4-benzoquinol methylase
MTAVDATRSTVPCNLCGSDRFEVVLPALPAVEQALNERYRSSSDDVCRDQVVRCRGCDLVYINPRPPLVQIEQGYAEAVDETYVSQAEGRLHAFRRIARQISRAKRPEGGRLLDVGAAAGFFLVAAREQGWKVEGIELSSWLSDWAKQHFDLTIHTSPLAAGQFPPRHFDVVTMFDVLEHVDDPKATVRVVRDVLEDDGLFVLSYPDWGSIFARLLKRRWWFLLSVHLFYFTRTTIRRLLEQNGFEVISMQRLYPSLQLGYLIQRLEVYSPLVGRSLGAVVRTLGLQDRSIPYYASQTLVFTRPKSE